MGTYTRATIFAAAAFGILVPVSVPAARFPNAVEKTVVIRGNAAVSVATLLGLSSSGSSAISLQLGRMDAWAVYLLKRDTKKELSNGDSPPRYNLVRFSESPDASLTIEPFWLDLGTQLPETKAGYYSFSSPFISQDLTSNDPWTRLLRRLRNESGWSGNGYPQFRQCFTSAEESEICISVFGAKDYTDDHERSGYAVRITAHPSS
jgi:hypothetical protein